jgi:hypothetical protein
MIIRVRALWSDSRPVVGVAIFLSLLNIITFITVLSLEYFTATIIPYTWPFTGCLIFPTFKPIYLIFIASILFETYVIVAILAKCVPLALSPKVRSPLSTILVTDGLIYYIIILAFQLLDIVLSFAGETPVSMPVIASYPITALVGVACNRLFIRLQGTSLVSDPEPDMDSYDGKRRASAYI